MDLNLPIVEHVSGCENLLIAGMGGGFDIFCGLPLFFELQKRGINAHLANYSFSDIVNFDAGTRLSPTLVGVDHRCEDLVLYFPELHLARWFKEHRDSEISIWSFQKTGVVPLLADYRLLVEHLQIDGILLVDGGVDSLVRGDEEEVGTLVEDAISLCAVNELDDIPVRLLACISMGAERGISYNQILENIAELAREGGYLGCCSLIGEMEVYRAFESAVLHTQTQPMQDPSVINSSIISAVRGECGDHHFTAKTDGSRLNITPFMGIYWFFDMVAVAAQNRFLNSIAHTTHFMQVVQIYAQVCKFFEPRERRILPL